MAKTNNTCRCGSLMAGPCVHSEANPKLIWRCLKCGLSKNYYGRKAAEKSS